MRPFANFTFHAILAAAIAALATTSAAAGAGRLTLGSAAAGGGGHIEVESYSWGATGSGSGLGGWAKADGLAVNFDPAGQGGSASSDMVMKGSKIGENAPATSPAVTRKRGRAISAIPKPEVVSPRDVATGQASGRRQQEPPAKGSLTVRASLPGCAAGAAYSTAELATDAARYELADVTIADCAADSITLNYAKVTVRGWDPAR